MQPVVHLTVDGGQRAEVTAGTAVTLEAVGEAPAGTIVALEWDPEGSGKWTAAEDGVDGTQPSVRATREHTFTTPGTYFPSVRATSHRDGDVAATHARIPNLARVRVVVTGR